MRESCTSGSVRGASSDRRLYSTLWLSLGVSRAATLPCLSNQAFFEWCFVVTPGACSKTDPTLLTLGFFGAVFFGFLASRPDRFCPFAIVTSNHDCRWMMMGYSQIGLFDPWGHELPRYLRYAAIEVLSTPALVAATCMRKGAPA